MRHRALWLQVAALSLSLVTTLTHAGVGRTPGTFAVSPTGAATYQIPIWMPPGPRGIQPNLALSYDSDTDNTTLGVGWTLSGLSAITRCNATYAQHGVAIGVTLTDWDAYCLDGSSLRLGTGTYGTAGSTYFTELANFAKVTANGTAGYGPQYFVVQGKDGLTYEYGNSPDSRVLLRPEMTTPYQWLLNKVYDRSGNNYKVTYYAGETGSVGIAIPRTIQYTPVSSGSATYKYTIDFTYTTRVTVNAATLTANITGWIANASYVNPNLLSVISVSSGGSLLRKYSLAYETASTPTTGARLKTITECAGSAGTDCYSPTTMVYQDGSVATNSSAVTVVNGNYYVLGAFDFNSDGRTDILYRDSNNALYVTYSTGSGYTTPVALGVTYTPYGPSCVYQQYCPYPSSIDFVDAAGTGGVDVMIPVSNVWWRYRWNGSALVGVSTGISSVNQGIWRDFNGDGLPDLISLSASGSGASISVSLAVNLNTSTAGVFSLSTVATVAWTTSMNCAGGDAGYCYLWLASSVDGFDPSLTAQSGAARRVGFDANGDGRADVVIRRYIGNPWVPPYTVISDSTVLTSQGNAYLGGSTQAANYYTTITRYAKINDDACSDYLYVGYWSTGYTNSTSVQISDCNGNAGSTIPLSYTVLGVVDWDRDGRQDLIVDSGGYLAVMYSQGTSFSAPVSTAILATGTLPGALLLDANGDGQWDLGRSTTSGITYNLHENPAGSNAPNKLASITDGFGVATSIAYTVGNFPNGTSVATLPESPVSEPLTVVGQVTQSDGVGGTFTQAYNYSGAREDTQGRGFSGFQIITISDSRAATPVVKSYYKTAFPYTGMVYQQDVFQNNGSTPISHTVNTPATLTLDGSANNQRYFAYLSNSTVNSYEIDGRLITTTSTNNGTPDSYGNFSNVSTTTTDNDTASPYYNQSWTTTTINTITNDTGANWCLGRPSSVTVAQSASNGETSVSRTTNYSIDYTYCRITQQVVAPVTAYQVTTAFGYDSFGNVNNQTVTGYNMAARTTTSNWGSTGQFPISVSNALSQTFSAGYDYNLGLQTSQTDANNLTTSWTYDSFGRKTLETRPDGTSTLWSYGLCSGCDPLPRMVVTTQPRDSVGAVISTRSDYFDMLDRPIYQLNQLLDGSTVWTTRDYDVLGNVLHGYVPYLSSGGNNGYITYSYDALNRLIKQQPSSGTALTTQYQYAGRITTVIDANNHATTTITDVNGWTRKTTDANSYTITNAYDAAGSLTGVTDSQSGTLFSASYAYGIQPFKTSTWDSDLGPVGYTPNALGEVVAYTDAKGQSFSIAYDPLSRPIQRTEAEGTTTWLWGTSAASHNIGQLQCVFIGTGSTCASSTYLEAYTYDSVGRLSDRQITSDTTYNYDFTYNTQGQIDTLTYPTSTAGYRLKLQYLYQTGMLRQVKDYNASTIFWQANAMNPRGQLTQEQLGNGIIANRNYDPVTGWLNYIQCGIGGGACSQNQSYLYDNVGNVIQRQNNNLGLTENFNYDAVNRLASSTLNGTQNLGVSYDGQGNITSRSDVGSFDYTTQQASCGSYAGYTPQPHAVRKAAGNVYCYDKNGNMTSRAGNSIGWTTYNYPSQITGNSETINLYYDVNRQRYKQIYTASGITETTMYVGGLMEKVNVNGIDDYRYSIYGNGQLIALMSRTSAGANTTRYVLTDAQGSVAKFTDSSGSSIVSESFTAFGARRNPQTWSGQPTYGDQTNINGISRDGYTGHTALGNLGLNHMNGRVQDAVTGRFLSADPYITEPGNTQNYNRYSYVYNNPLSYTDPSGFGVNVNDCERPGVNFIDCMKKYWEQQYGSSSTVLQPVTVTAVRIEVPLPMITITARRPLDGWDLQVIGNWVSNVFGNQVQAGPTGSPQTPKPGTCPNTAGNYAKQFVNDTASTILGIADAFTFGGYTKMTESLGLGAVDHNLAYNAGLYGTAGISAGRLLYAGAAATIQYVPAISAADAVATRNTLKGVFSTLGADHPRAYSASAMMSRYGSEAEVIKAASRTNANLNTAAAELGYSAASQTGVSGCP